MVKIDSNIRFYYPKLNTERGGLSVFFKILRMRGGFMYSYIKFKLFLSIAFISALLIFIIPNEISFADYETITPWEIKTVQTAPGQQKTYKFIAPADGNYTFGSSNEANNCDTVLFLKDVTLNQELYDEDRNEEGILKNNSSFIQYPCVKGRIYYVTVKEYYNRAINCTLAISDEITYNGQTVRSTISVGEKKFVNLTKDQTGLYEFVAPVDGDYYVLTHSYAERTITGEKQDFNTNSVMDVRDKASNVTLGFNRSGVTLWTKKPYTHPIIRLNGCKKNYTYIIRLRAEYIQNPITKQWYRSYVKCYLDVLPILTMQKTGPKFIYSNHPEDIHSDWIGSGAYTIHETLVPNTDYVVEFYHHLLMGNIQVQGGIAIKNDSGSNRTITIQKKGFGFNEKFLSAVKTSLDYQKSTYYQQKTLVPGEIYIVPNDLLDNIYNCNSKNADKRTATGRVGLSANGDNVKIRVFFKTKDNTLNPFALNRAQWQYDSPLGQPIRYRTQTTGSFQNNTRILNVDANINKIFYLNSGFVGNDNEYETGTNYLGPSAIQGNYGIIYELHLLNASGKKLVITPSFEVPYNLESRVILYTSDLGWISTNHLKKYDTSQDKFWKTNIPDDGIVKFTLPGGNGGHLQFKIVDQ